MIRDYRIIRIRIFQIRKRSRIESIMIRFDSNSNNLHTSIHHHVIRRQSLTVVIETFWETRRDCTFRKFEPYKSRTIWWHSSWAKCFLLEEINQNARSCRESSKILVNHRERERERESVCVCVCACVLRER